MSEYIAKAPIEPRDYRVVFLIQKSSPAKSWRAEFYAAAGRTRTGTDILRLILSQVCLPIPPQRLIRLPPEAKSDYITWENSLQHFSAPGLSFLSIVSVQPFCPRSFFPISKQSNVAK